MKTLRVLTIREPWASLIGKGIKTIETRSWQTNDRGKLYIHAGLCKPPKNDIRINKMMSMLTEAPHYGEIFLECNLSDCIYIDKKFAENAKVDNPINFMCGDYKEGRYAWIFTDIKPIVPIKATGHLSIWKYDINELD